VQLNKCSFIGNLGGDTEVHRTKDRKPVISFNLAVNSGFGENRVTAWTRISVFGRQAEWLESHPGFKGDTAVVIAAEYRVHTAPPRNNEPDEQVREYHGFSVTGFGSDCWILPKQAHSENSGSANATPTKADDDDLPF